jgi:hypothetical protein
MFFGMLSNVAKSKEKWRERREMGDRRKLFLPQAFNHDTAGKTKLFNLRRFCQHLKSVTIVKSQNEAFFVKGGATGSKTPSRQKHTLESLGASFV